MSMLRLVELAATTRIGSMSEENCRTSPCCRGAHDCQRLPQLPQLHYVQFL